MLLLVLVLVCSLIFSACSSNSEPKTEGGSGGTSEKPVTLKVEVFDRGNSPAGYTITDNYWTKWIGENFGKPNNIDVKFVPVPRSEEVEKLNVLMASGSDVPDIVFTYDSSTFYRYAQQGGLTDLSELIEQHAPNLKAFLGEEVLAYGQLEGTQYSIPAKRANLGKYSSFIRQDWLDKLSLPVPQSTDELYNTLKAFKEKDPGATGGKAVPLGMTIAPAQYEPLIWSFIKSVSEEEQFTLTQQLGSRDYPVLLPGFKDALQFMNKLYNEGLMSADFGLDEDKKKLTEDVSKGLIGFFSEDDANIYGLDGTYDLLQKNVSGATISAVDVYTNEEGKHAKPKYAPVGLYIMIPKSSERAVEAIKYLDWMATEDVLFEMQNGIEGENYTLKDGIPVALENPTEEAKNRMYNIGDMTIVTNGKQLGSDEKNNEVKALQYPQAQQDQVRTALKISNSDTIPPILTPRPIEAQTKYGSTLLDKFHEMLVKTTMAKPEQFESTYESMMKDYMASGGQAIKDERTEVYQEMK
jgi:putative aldouronate transport system substrate-binding protein